MVQALGRHHAGYDVQPAHYGTVAQALLWTLEQGLKDDFTPEVKEAWTTVYTLLADTMIAAAEQADSPENSQPDQKLENTVSTKTKSKSDNENDQLIATLNAIGASQAMIEFELDGTIITANPNFCAALGYELSEIQGQHHSIFADEEFKKSAEYAQFWENLRAGKFQAGEFMRITKDGSEIWIQAAYNPVLDAAGKPFKVVKNAVDITATKKEQLKAAAETAGLVATLDGIGASQAMIEFELDGTIITANPNFCAALGYELSEIQGQHHSIFADEEFKKSAEYAQFWENLRAGKFQAGEFMRITKSGDEIWIQAAYNPVLDDNGKPFKVVKNAVDITAAKTEQLEAAAKTDGLVATLDGIGASQAMIEFELDGTIITANPNFCAALGYELSEIQGQHHSIFADEKYKESAEYAQFWDDLRAGKFQAGEFMRITKSGDEIWIQAAYNPVLDDNGKPFKVVKNAVDITAAKRATRSRGQDRWSGSNPRRYRQQPSDDRVRDGRHDHHRQREFPAARWAMSCPRSRASITAFSPKRSSGRAPNTPSSGLICAPASSRPVSSCASTRTARRSGFRRPTTRCSTPTASPTRSSRTPSTSPPRRKSSSKPRPRPMVW